MSTSFQTGKLTEFTTSNNISTGNAMTLFTFRTDLFHILTNQALPPARHGLYTAPELAGFNLALVHDETHRVRVVLDKEARLCISQGTTIVRGQTKIQTEAFVTISPQQMTLLMGIISRFVAEWIEYIKENITIDALRSRAGHAQNTDFAYAANLCHLYHTYLARSQPAARDTPQEKESAFYSACLFHLKSASPSVVFQHLKDSKGIFAWKSNLAPGSDPVEELDNVYTYDHPTNSHGYMFYLRIKPSYSPASCRFAIAPLITREQNVVNYEA
ncbi:hypothetical protein [Cimodo virus]|uniref:hypothetical protein n=1 Tax=Cimodo virus TaxID=1427476 RepID=UPI0003E76805|nr:hypothetical protein [Cimodo virus]AHF20712.1 hypothetical protein [Cimodo virus]AHF20724.1 hypothetical protein [Cimodo virus]